MSVLKKSNVFGQSAPSMFSEPTNRGTHCSPSAFTTTEPRFLSLQHKNSTDSMYKLPDTISKKYIGFGTSTREDWDTKPKKSNAMAGPGSYNLPPSCGKQVLSDNRSAVMMTISQATKDTGAQHKTLSPGPAYEVTTFIGDANAFSFGTSLRKPLYGITNGPGPSLNLKGSFKKHEKMVRSTFGSQKRMRRLENANNPGPVYNLEQTGFRTGPSSSFSSSRRF